MYDYDRGHAEDGTDPRSQHGCTDPLCCLLFLVALGAFGCLYRQCVAQGDIGKLYHGIDWNGRVCGVDAFVAEKPYLYWCASDSSDGHGLIFNTGKPICVASCPGNSQQSSLIAPIYDMQPECALLSGSLSNMVSYRTVVLLNRYCIPDAREDHGASQEIISQLNEANTRFAEALSSVPSSWPVLLSAFGVATVFGYVYLVLLRHCAGPLIWLCIVGCVVGFAVLGILLWVNAGNILQDMPGGSDLRAELGSLSEHEEWATRVAGAACIVIAGLIVCLAHCLQHSIQVATAVVVVSCEAIFKMPSLLLAPIVKVAVKGFAFLALVYGFLLLWSSSRMSVGENGVMRHFSHDDEQTAFLWFYFFMSVWILAFLNALYQFIVAYAVAEFYYTPYDSYGEKDVGCCVICDGVHVGLLYHSGSLAFGSLLIALLTVLQKMIEWAERQNRETVNNSVISCLLCCADCLVGCCKDLVMRVNRMAYIDMAITSRNFCDAAQEALSMLAQIAASLGILTGATFIFTVLGVLATCLAVAFFTYTISQSGEYADHSSAFYVESRTTVLGASVAVAFLVAMSFMNIFDVAGDTLLYCYGMDMHSGKGGHTAPPALRELVHGG